MTVGLDRETMNCGFHGLNILSHAWAHYKEIRYMAQALEKECMTVEHLFTGHTFPLIGWIDQP